MSTACHMCDHAPHKEWCPSTFSAASRQYHAGYYDGRTGQRRKRRASEAYRVGYLKGKACNADQRSIRNTYHHERDVEDLRVLPLGAGF